jgi:hypothetical protein
MNEIRPETHAPKHHSYRAKPTILILIGLVVGGALYFGVMAWYFTGGFGPIHAGHGARSNTRDGGGGTVVSMLMPGA